MRDDGNRHNKVLWNFIEFKTFGVGKATSSYSGEFHCSDSIEFIASHAEKKTCQV